MKGTVTYFDKETNCGSIQSEDGRMLSFDYSKVIFQQGEYPLSAGLKIDFDAEGDDVNEVRVLKDQELIEDNIFYKEPQQVGIAKSLPGGFELIDKGQYPLFREERNSRNLKLRLIDDCEKVGGNVLLDYKEERIVRNSIGFSFYVYKGSAVPAVMGIPDEKGGISLLELKKKLNHRKLEKIKSEAQSSAMWLKILKITGALLLIIFTIGFFVSLDK